MIRIILDNLIYMGIAAAVICVLMLIIGSVSRGKISARLLWSGWLTAVLTLLFPLYALFGILQLTAALGVQSPGNTQYHVAYSDTMDQTIGGLLAPAETKTPSLSNPSFQEKDESSSLDAPFRFVYNLLRVMKLAYPNRLCADSFCQ